MLRFIQLPASALVLDIDQGWVRRHAPLPSGQGKPEYVYVPGTDRPTSTRFGTTRNLTPPCTDTSGLPDGERIR